MGLVNDRYRPREVPTPWGFVCEDDPGPLPFGRPAGADGGSGPGTCAGCQRKCGRHGCRWMDADPRRHRGRQRTATMPTSAPLSKLERCDRAPPGPRAGPSRRLGQVGDARWHRSQWSSVCHDHEKDVARTDGVVDDLDEIHARLDGVDVHEDLAPEPCGQGVVQAPCGIGCLFARLPCWPNSAADLGRPRFRHMPIG
jgi:hypothetical protein